MCDVSGVCRKACCLRQINTTGNLCMADLRDLPVGQNQNLFVIAGRLWERHCERSEAIHFSVQRMDCFVASLLAMTWITIEVERHGSCCAPRPFVEA